MDSLTRLKLKRLTRAVYDSTDLDPREPRRIARLLPGPGTALALILVIAAITSATLWNAHAGPVDRQALARAETPESASSAPVQSAREPNPAAMSGERAGPGGGEASASQVVVHIVGEVAAPGVYTLPRSSRVIDALESAGGPTAEADLQGVNLARPLVDGEQIVIPGPGAQPGPVAAGGATGEPDCIDLNTATAAQLEELDGVGPSLAQRIIDYREQAGGFASVEQLDAVSGIGASTLDKIRPGVCR